MSMRYEKVKSSEWRIGDVILTSGLQVRIDREIEEYAGWGNAPGPIFHTRGIVVNIEQIDASDEWLSRFVRSDRRDGDGGEVRWTLQGNDHASWGRVIEAEEVSK